MTRSPGSRPSWRGLRSPSAPRFWPYVRRETGRSTKDSSSSAGSTKRAWGATIDAKRSGHSRKSENPCSAVVRRASAEQFDVLGERGNHFVEIVENHEARV